jgi:hypothetical protein
VTALEACGRFDPALGRLPGAFVHALFRGDDWLATSSLSITAALEAAAPNTRIAWVCDWAVFKDLGTGSGGGLVSGRARPHPSPDPAGIAGTVRDRHAGGL